MKGLKKIIVGFLIFFVVELGIAYCVCISIFSPTIKVDYYDTYFSVIGGGGLFNQLGCNINYSNIISYEIHDTIYGNKATNVEKTYKNYEVGGFYNDTYGDYHSYVSRASKKSVIINYTLREETIKCVIGLRKTEDVLDIVDHIVDNTNLNVTYN